MSEVKAPPMWPAQEEALRFALTHDATMLDMDMGTGKTRVAIEAMRVRGTSATLVVCPKAVMGVWPSEIAKYAEPWEFVTFQRRAGETVRKTAERLWDFMNGRGEGTALARRVIVINYDSVWRRPLGDYVLRLVESGAVGAVILDESHRAKAAGSKVSKYLAMLGRRAPVRMCLSGTPMANSPLDVYGQYRFLDRSIFGTNHDRFLQEYAVMGGPERRFVIGYKNQRELMDRFSSIAYSCRMSEVADRLKLPPTLPPATVPVELPARDVRLMRELSEEFVAECGGGFVTASSVLTKLLRMQQVCAGFCPVQEGPGAGAEVRDLNRAKADALGSVMDDLPPADRLVVFCVFQHDLDMVSEVTEARGRPFFELSGRRHDWESFRASEGAVVAVQIQAGAEGVDMTAASRAVYFSLPHSLALYEQSKARLARPGQSRPVQFIHLIATDTVDEAMYASLQRKRDVIDSIRDGTFDYGYVKR